MTAVGVPEWGPLTMFYDPAGQEPSIVREIAPDGRAVNFLLDRLTITLNSGADAISLKVTTTSMPPARSTRQIRTAVFLLADKGTAQDLGGRRAH